MSCFIIHCYFDTIKYIVMKKLIFSLVLLATAKFSFAQEKESIERACLNYIEGFYEGDTTKLIAA